MKNLKEILISFAIMFLLISSIITYFSKDEKADQQINLENNVSLEASKTFYNNNDLNKILKDFLKNELNKKVDLTKEKIKLKIVSEIKNLNGAIDKLPNNYKIPFYETIEADPTKANNVKVQINDEISLINYINKGKDKFGNYSRCKIRVINGRISRLREGWISCEWITAEITKTISK